MAKKQIEKLSGKSKDIAAEQITAFKNIFPQAVKDGKVDFDVLKQLLSSEIESPQQSYGLSWAGKNECFRHIQETTAATLKPVRSESVDFDNTENIFIEGDNLEVLKVLQANYYGKIKMIYIDPPYNTGNDSFIYPDKFKEEKGEYEQRAGIRDAEGLLTKDGFWRKNFKDSGHFHSTWLSMMYPRLFLAKNLLRQDGVIFVSIDDNEVHNLRMVMNEIFGEENFVANIVWQKKYSVSNDDPSIAPMHDHIIVYQKSDEFQRNLLPRTDKQLERYSNPDNDLRGLWASGEYVSSKSKNQRPTLWYPIKHPKTGEEIWPDENAVWRYAKEKHVIMEKENRLYWGPNMSYKKPRLKRFLSEIQEGTVPSTWWTFNEVGHNDEGQKETALILGKKIFSTPKPVRLITHILKIAAKDDDVILDFFAGSGTTAQAVMQLNIEDGGNRKFICVQLAEPCEEESEAFKAGFKTIADIGKERIRRAAKKIKKEVNGLIADYEKNPKLFEDENLKSKISNLKALDLGFKVFKLNESNFKQWQENIKTADELKEQMKLFVDNTKKGTPAENMLYEIILKNSRFDLNVKAEKKTFDGIEYYVLATHSTGSGQAEGTENTEIVCLTEKITKKFVDKAIELKPEKFTCLDAAFKNNDQLKTNTALQMDAEKIEFKVI